MAAKKKGPLSGQEKEYITQNYATKKINVMARKLNRSQLIVAKYVNTLPCEEEQSQEVEKIMSRDLFARNKERGVVVMTEAASMASDENKKSKKDKEVNVAQRYQRHIHRIKD